MNLEDQVERLRLLKETFKLARRIMNDKSKRLDGLAEKLSAMDPPVAWHDPPDDPRGRINERGKIIYFEFRASQKERNYTPVPGKAGEWSMARGVSAEDKPPGPVNLEFGKECHEAWCSWHDAGTRFSEAKNALEAAIREMVDSDA